MFERIRIALRRLVLGNSRDRAGRKDAAAREDGSFRGPGTDAALSFESDYRAATDLLKARMDAGHPAACHGRLTVADGSVYGYGERRMEIVDTASTAIAMALRDGATVTEAAEAGAASVGI